MYGVGVQTLDKYTADQSDGCIHRLIAIQQSSHALTLAFDLSRDTRIAARSARFTGPAASTSYQKKPAAKIGNFFHHRA